MLRVIDNKRIDLTDDEFKLYKEICSAYDDPPMVGEDLFKGLFETDEKGVIVFLKPPIGKFAIESYMFLVNTMIHQHLGLACKQIDELKNEARPIIDEMKKMIEESKSLISDLKKG